MADISANGSSLIVILWWVAVWILVDEAIEFVSGNRKYIKLAVCLIIIFSVVVTCSLYPEYIRHF